MEIYYFVDWGDNTNSQWKGSYKSGKEITLYHIWFEQGNYKIKVISKDTDGAESDWTELPVNMPRNKATISSLFLRFLERFPLLEHLLNL